MPGLYNTLELESLVAVLKDDADRENFDGSLLQYFTESKYLFYFFILLY